MCQELGTCISLDPLLGKSVASTDDFHARDRNLSFGTRDLWTYWVGHRTKATAKLKRSLGFGLLVFHLYLFLKDYQQKRSVTFSSDFITWIGTTAGHQ